MQLNKMRISRDYQKTVFIWIRMYEMCVVPDKIRESGGFVSVMREKM